MSPAVALGLTRCAAVCSEQSQKLISKDVFAKWSKAPKKMFGEWSEEKNEIAWRRMTRQRYDIIMRISRYRRKLGVIGEFNVIE